MKAFIFTSFAVLILTGCSLSPDYRRPDVNAPGGWAAGEAEQPTAISRDWWTNFGSRELDTLMQQALDANHDLRAGVYRVEQSRAALKIAGARLLPGADASAGASRSRSEPASGKTNYATGLRAGAGIAYELDLFGANRASVEAAKAGLNGAQFDQDALALVIMGDVAQGYFNLVNLRERLRVADQNLDNAREVLRIVQARFDAGRESALEVSRQKTALASSEAGRAALAEQAANAENALAVLLGQPPGQIRVEAASLEALDIPAIAPGVPSTLLERRPDIRAAEARLIAANADIGVARAAFFPNVTMGLDWSVAATGFGDPASTALALASSLAMPIFQGGRLEAGVEQATARQKELVENYRQGVLTAFREVEDALIAVRTAEEREISLATAMREARASYSLTKQLYDAGSIDFQTLLDVQGTLLGAEDNHAQAKMDRLAAAVYLYLALGGGWP